MIKREIVKIDNLLTYKEMKSFESELLSLNSLKQNFHSNNKFGELSNLSRVFMDKVYMKNRSDSFILNTLSLKLFSDLIFSKIGEVEILLRLIQFSNHHETQYTVYKKGGKYHWHVDSAIDDIRNPKTRVANYIFYMNDDFEGGELELSFKTDIDIYDNKLPFNPPVHMVITPKKNTLVIIPSDMWHRVKPITKGERRTVNGHVGFR